MQAVLGLDMTICNVALPDIRRALFGADYAGLAWVADGYSLAYGGLLLAGGRLADLAGPRAVLAAGVTMFALASACAGVAWDPQLLVAARIAQGAGAALAAPASLSLATRITPAGQVRKVLAAYAAAGGAGAAAGQLAGGVIIAAAGWRWVFLVNVPAGLALAAAAVTVLPAVPGAGRAGRLHVPGALAGTGALLALVYGVLRAGEAGWADHRALGAFVAAGALAVAFTAAEAGPDPLVPGDLLRGRDRLAGLLTGALTYAWMYPVLFVMTQVMQGLHGWTALRAGAYWLPTGLGTVAGGLAVARPLSRRLPAPVMLAACAMILCGSSLWLALDTAASGYVGGMLLPFAAAGLALGTAMAANIPRAAAGGASAGVAAGLLGTCQQVGAAVSLAVAAALAASGTRNAVTAWAAVHRMAPPPSAVATATMHGYSTALTMSAVIAVAAAAAQALPGRLALRGSECAGASPVPAPGSDLPARQGRLRQAPGRPVSACLRGKPAQGAASEGARQSGPSPALRELLQAGTRSGGPARQGHPRVGPRRARDHGRARRRPRPARAWQRQSSPAGAAGGDTAQAGVAHRTVRVGAGQEQREQELTRQVLDALGMAGPPRVRQLLTRLVAHLHEYAREVRLTDAEFRCAVDFVAAAGQATTGRRNECLLAADVLGLTALLAMINAAQAGDATESTLTGPFFEEGSPEIALGGDLSRGADGTPLWVEGTIRDPGGSPVSGARIEVWGSDADGLYDVQYADGRVQNRGHLFSDDAGGYRFWALRPVAYPLPGDGPAGRLLAATGNSGMRAAHLHLQVSAPDCQTLITHIFDADCAWLERDGVFGVRPSLVRRIEPGTPGDQAAGGRRLSRPWARVRFDIVLARLAAPADRGAEVVVSRGTD